LLVCKNAKNYRGITVTPTLSKIIEKILKIRENGKILLNQNPLQKGFTENSSPLLCELGVSNPYHNSHLWSVLLVVQSVISILLVSGLLYCVFDFQHKVRQ
jgi:hypothetical protein